MTTRARRGLTYDLRLVAAHLRGAAEAFTTDAIRLDVGANPNRPDWLSGYDAAAAHAARRASTVVRRQSIAIAAIAAELERVDLEALDEALT